MEMVQDKRASKPRVLLHTTSGSNGMSAPKVDYINLRHSKKVKKSH